MTKIIELIDDFQLEQKIGGRKKRYIVLCTYKLNRWKDFMNKDFQIDEVEEVKPIHIKKFIQFCQSSGLEKKRTLR